MIGSPSREPSTLGPARGSPSDTRGGSRMRECRTYGSVRGALSNERPYRDRRLRADARGREAGRGPRPASVAGDAAVVDERGRPVGAAQGPPRAGPPAPPPPRPPRRAGADRRLPAPLARGPRAALHAARLRRRRDQPADAPP